MYISVIRVLLTRRSSYRSNGCGSRRRIQPSSAMANTKPVVDTPETLNRYTHPRKGGKNPYSAVRLDLPRDEGTGELTDFHALRDSGACGFTDDGIPLLDESLVQSAMLQAKALNVPLSFHEEDPFFIEKSGTNRTAPAVAEDVLVARDCMMALHTGATIHIQHISSAHSVALVRCAKALGAPVFAEATPHHFTLTEEAVNTYGTYAKMNPPLRTEADRLAIIEGLQDGTIDCIATDHAPHSTEEKKKDNFFAAPSGIIGLETALALGITQLVKPGHLTLMQLMEKMSLNPARLYHLDGGTIAEGRPADLVLFHPDETFVCGNYQSKAENTPFTGWELYGKVHATICGGKIVWRG